MVFENFDATCFDNVKHTFPELGGVVTVENCIYYLSMLEQFVCLREQFHDYIDAFHARAELRYSLWVEGCKHRSDLDDLNTVIIPPIGKIRRVKKIFLLLQKNQNKKIKIEFIDENKINY